MTTGVGRHFPAFVQNIASGHIQQAEIQNSALIITNIGQFNAGFTAFGLIDLNILVLRDFTKGIGKHGIIINKQNTYGKLP
tara:strand:+ start:306 stop:548 length:243 start_codon:yes stop_codon:yes gene_type:complete